MSSSDRGRRGGRLIAAIAFWLGVVALAAGGLTTVARSVPFSWVPIASDDWAMATSFTDFGIVAYALSLVCLGAALVAARLPAPGDRRRCSARADRAARLLDRARGSSPTRPGPGRPPRCSGSWPSTCALARPIRPSWSEPRTASTSWCSPKSPSRARRALLARRAGRPIPVRAGGRSSGDRRQRHHRVQPLPDHRRRPGCRPAIAHQNWLVRIDVPDTGAVELAAVHPTRPFAGGYRLG